MDIGDKDIKSLTEVLTEYIVNSLHTAITGSDKQNNKWDGQITERQGFKNRPELKRLFFSLANKTVSNKLYLPKRTGRLMNILRNSQYTYIEAVAASVIDMALEGNVSAAKLVLCSICKDNNDEINASEGK